ncbi:MFS transporter [Collimonas pratensis]|uniref:MFS transporter n=1 Tax=Collimonas pratensis TaxID=279113 RepID=UPI00143CD7CC|nr:MFS transporter [Collimonas pratensis]NKI72292.1 MFS transporter [Collimonas pratensis]
MRNDSNRLRWLIATLGLTQIIGWGTMFYAYGVLMGPMQTALHTSKPVVVGAYSVALLVSGCLSTFAGAIIDRFGGRILMGAGSVLAAALLALLSHVDSVAELYLVWAGIGIAMSATLYQPAFAVITQIFGAEYRRAITLLTLFGGFASTIFWPLTQFLLGQYGWRETWMIYAIANLVLCVPVHALLPVFEKWPSAATTAVTANKITLATVLREPRFYLATGAITLNALVFSAMSLHLISILQARGVSPGHAAAIGAMVGPMQVLGRILETTIGKKATSRQVALIAIWLLPLSLALLLAPSEWLFIYGVFAAMYGIGNGVMTIVRGTLPAELYGRETYGAISGAMATPVLIAIAAGPFVASLVYSLTGGYAGTILALIGIALLGAVLFIYVRTHSSQAINLQDLQKVEP